jgi:dimethylhistidine N-methyltransferase
MSFERDVVRALTARPKHLECRWFYDEAGSKLFQEICELEEYYIPRAEREILDAHREELLSLSPKDALIVELGSGDSAKTRMIISSFHARYGRARYLPIDISESALEQSTRALLADFPRLEVQPYAGEYDGAVRHLREQMREVPKLILFLGSNIGNFDRQQAARFLAELRRAMDSSDRLLLGIDRRKDRKILEPAYDDPRGVTARFNLNLLARINRELGGDFDLSAFAHRAEYQEAEGRIAMYLESLRSQSVRIGAQELRFDAGERIHTEYSYKYSDSEIEELAMQAGLQIVRRWTDAEGLFCSVLLARE